MPGMRSAHQFVVVTWLQVCLLLGSTLAAGPVIAESTSKGLTFPPHSGRYFVLKTEGKWPLRTIHVKRVGSSGTSFFVRQYDCVKWKTRYLATGDSVADLAKSKPEADMSEIVPGATADYIGQLACKK